MIRELTKQQQDQLAPYAAKWIEIGLSTTTDYAGAEKAIDTLYQVIRRPPPRKIWLQSPLAGALTVAILGRLPHLVSSVVGKSLNWNAVDSAVRSAVDSAVDSAVRSAVDSAVDSAVRSAVDSAVDSAVRSAVGVYDWAYPWWGSLNPGWASFFMFMADVLKIEIPLGGHAYAELVKTCGFYWCFEHAVFLTEKPTAIHRNAAGRLHKDGGGLAIEYGDGWGLYMLNGVRVPRELVETAGPDLDPVSIAKEPNVEVRREIVKKIGLPSIVRRLGGKVVDSWDCESYSEPYKQHVAGLGQLSVAFTPAKLQYELLEFNFGPEVPRARALKMNNPSVDEIHVEFVPEEINTVQEALAWREQDTVYIQPTVRT
jgi:hypothetical protein